MRTEHFTSKLVLPGFSLDLRSIALRSTLSCTDSCPACRVMLACTFPGSSVSCGERRRLAYNLRAMAVPPDQVDSLHTCIRCGAGLQVRSQAGEGNPAPCSFSCPLCACPNTVLVIVCTAVMAVLQCGCGRAVEVTVAPLLSPPMVTEEGKLEGGVDYERLTMTRSLLKCPACGRPHFVYGRMKKIA